MILIASAAPVRGESVDAPTWTVGDFWTYRTNTTLAPGLDLTGTATSTVHGPIAVEVGATTVQATRIILSGSGTASGTVTTRNGTVAVQGTWILTGEERFTPDDLQPVYSLLDLSVNGTYEYIVPVPFTLRLQNTTTYRILSDGWRYPMVVGTAGNVTVAYNFTQDVYSPVAGHLRSNGTGETTTSFALSAAVSVATAAGTFSAYPLRTTAEDGSSQRLYYAMSVGNHVRTETYDSSGNLTAVDTLTAYRYQAAEPATFLGLTTTGWILVIAVVTVAMVLIAFVGWRSRRQRAPHPPPNPETDEPTSGPRGP